MHRRINRKHHQLEFSRSPHLQLLHLLHRSRAVRAQLPVLRWTQVQEEADRDDEGAPEAFEDGEVERRCGCGVGGDVTGDEGGVWGGDWVSGEVELVEPSAAEEVEGVGDGGGHEEESHWDGLRRQSSDFRRSVVRSKSGQRTQSNQGSLSRSR